MFFNFTTHSPRDSYTEIVSNIVCIIMIWQPLYSIICSINLLLALEMVKRYKINVTLYCTTFNSTKPFMGKLARTNNSTRVCAWVCIFKGFQSVHSSLNTVGKYVFIRIIYIHTCLCLDNYLLCVPTSVSNEIRTQGFINSCIVRYIR